MNKSPEHLLQSRCMTWFRYQYPHFSQLMFAVPNGGLRSKAEAGKMRAEGVKAGVADIILDIPNAQYHQFDIEMKAGAQQSDVQKRFQEYAEAAGHKYIICRSYDQFKEEVECYLSSVSPIMVEAIKEVYKRTKDEEIEKARQKYQKLCNTRNH